ncbi:MAG: hypothetical protein J7621_08295 [Niastella sp.]|nr:hypothetical protein [Niastella sp.]
MWYNMQGCFGGEKLVLKVVTNDDESFALLSEEGKQEIRVKLSAVQQQAFEDIFTVYSGPCSGRVGGTTSQL